MNRKERRKYGIKEKPKTINVSKQRLDEMKMNISKEATATAFEWTMLIPLMVLHDKFNEVRMKEYDGACREEHFFDLCLEMYESFNEKYYTLSDLAETIKAETGFDVIKRFRHKKGFDKI